MFAFKPYDDNDVQGRSKDLLPEDLKKDFHFSVHCNGLDELDDMLFVRISENFIQFFRESDEVSEAEKGRVVESISLTNPKDTGYDLLYFADNVRKGTLFGKKNNLIENKTTKTNMEEFLNRGEGIFIGFPFFSDNKRKHKRNEKYNYDKVFLRLCLLEFLLAVDTHDEIFAIVPGYDDIRKKLRKSKVYLLLCAKLRYCMYHYNGREALNSEEYTFVVSKYADLLMDPDFGKIVQADYFDKPRFLYNPEYELKLIMRRDDSKIIDKSIRQKITNFFLTKHAVLESTLGRVRYPLLVNLFRIGHYLLMLLVVLWSIYALALFESYESVVSLFYMNQWWKLAVAVCLIIELVFAFIQSRSPVFHPRIIVALMIGWFTIAVSEDLIKSQLDLKAKTVLAALLAVLMIVGLLLMGEVRQHSPYYKSCCLWKAKIFPKTVPVLAYAMFWNLLLGVIMQQVTYSSLLETSGAVPGVVLGQLPKKVEMYKNSVETCISMLDDYDWCMDGVIHDYGKVDFHSKVTSRTFDTTLVLKADAFTLVGNSKDADIRSFINQHNEFLEQISDWIGSAGEYVEYDTALKELAAFAKVSIINEKASDSVRKLIENNLYETRRIKNKLRMQLLSIDDFVKNINDTRILIDMGEFKTKCEQKERLPVKTNNAYLAKLEKDLGGMHRYYRGVKIPFWDEIRIFPRMLIFHSLIVLIIAFVGNLIISDKSVTEPL